MKLRQKIDKAAFDQLERMVSTFPESWGEPSRAAEPGAFYLDGFDDGYEVLVQYDAKKQLLGGIFSLEFVLTGRDIYADGQGEALLRYKGRFVKGDAYFSSGKKDSALADELNLDAELIGMLGRLDLLSMTVKTENNRLKVSLSPLGGAYTYTVFPPMKYGGILPDGDLENIRKVLAVLIQKYPKAELKKVSGGDQ